MKINCYWHHPLNKLFGVQHTIPLGSVRFSCATWIFLGIVDVVIRS